MRCLNAVTLSVSFVLSLSGLAQAGIVEVGGDLVLAEPPADISNGLWTSDTEIRGWFERQVTLSADLTLDHVNPGFVDDPAQLVPGTLAADTTVWSYMVRLDPKTGGTHALTGYVVFDTPILGVLQDRPTLNATDDLLGRPGVTYNKNNNRGMELGYDGIEYFQISADRLRLDFVMVVVNGPTDDIRIVTAVPAPGGTAALALGMATLLRRRR